MGADRRRGGGVTVGRGGVAPQNFSLTHDGATVQGDVRLVRGAPAVVLVHGFKGFARFAFLPTVAESLAIAGLTTIAFDFSGSGVGEDRQTVSDPAAFERDTYGRELDELAAVVAHARAEGWLGDRYGLFGHSRGGGIAVLQGALDPGVRALVTWAAIADVDRWSDAERDAWREGGTLAVVNGRTKQRFALGTALLNEVESAPGTRLDIQLAARTLRATWLVVHGTADETVPIAESERLASLGAHAELLRVDGAGHTFGAVHPYAGETPALRTALDATVVFLSARLGAGTGR